MNKLLRDSDREKYKGLIEEMTQIVPEIMAKKYPLANVQQAWTLSTILEYILTPATTILCVGSFEDTSSAYLEKHNILVTNIDPEINTDLHYYVYNHGKKFDIVFSTSVIEHVEDDEEFIKDICLSLNKGGIAILTCDFNNSYKKGDAVIYPDFRFYTKEDLDVRFRKIIEDCGCLFVGDPNWEGEPDFHLIGFDYSFATIVFMKVK